MANKHFTIELPQIMRIIEELIYSTHLKYFPILLIPFSFVLPNTSASLTQQIDSLDKFYTFPPSLLFPYPLKESTEIVSC